MIMKKRRNKLSSDDEDVTKNLQNYLKKSKLGTKPHKNVELCLEVEMDDEVRNIIKSPDNNPSTLLDVTVIKPKELNSSQKTEKTTLKKDEVKKLIASMEIEKEDKQKLLEKIFGTTKTVAFASDVYNGPDYPPPGSSNSKTPPKKRPNSPKNKFHCSPDGDYSRNCPSDTETLSAVVSGLKKALSPGRKTSLSTIDERGVVQQIYTTPKTYNNLKSLFACKNKGRHDENRKPNQPCLCQNCAIVGILTDSQKKPFACEEMYDPQEFARRDGPLRGPKPCSSSVHGKKCVSFKNSQKSGVDNGHAQCQHYIKHLCVKIQELERRLAVQEDMIVSKDYFKKIITKIVNHITKLSDEVNKSFNSSKNKEPLAANNYYSKTSKNKYYVSPALIPNDKPSHPVDSRYEQRTVSSEGFWRWGSEILKPGIDLKNKIASMLEETIHNFKKVWDKEPKQENLDEELKGLVAEVSNNLCKAIRDTGLNRSPFEIQKEQVVYRVNSSSEMSSRYTSNKKYEKNVSNGKKAKKEMCDVAYVNPKLTSWLEESQISFKVESDIESSNKTQKYLNDQYKTEFVKTLEHTKASEKFKLWQSIWNQALANGQSKNDRVTIEMPDSREKTAKRTISIDFTIEEMENILVGNKNSQQKKTRP